MNIRPIFYSPGQSRDADFSNCPPARDAAIDCFVLLLNSQKKQNSQIGSGVLHRLLTDSIEGSFSENLLDSSETPGSPYREAYLLIARLWSQ